MATKQYISQPDGVGTKRVLRECECEHVVCVLRAVERLHLTSEVIEGENYASLQRRMICIHQNHQELRGLVAGLLLGQEVECA